MEMTLQYCNELHSYSHPRAKSVSVKYQTFERAEDFDEYLSKFKILVDLHGWNYREKSLYRTSSLLGNRKVSFE